MDYISFREYILYSTNWDNSLIILDNDKIMGLYLIGDKQLNHSDYKHLRGIEGVLLAIDESIRGNGWGTKLKDYVSTLGYDYVWGQQYKELNNLEDWLKRRKLVKQSGNIFITAQIF